MNILILRVSAIGDVIHTLSAVTLLRHCFPKARIDWVAQKKCADIIRAFPHVDNVWELDNRFLKPLQWRATWATIRELRKVTWDAIIDFQGIEKSTILMMFLRGKKYGFAKNHARTRLSTWFTHSQVTPEYTNIIQKNLALSSAVAYDLSHEMAQPTVQTLQRYGTLRISPEARSRVDTWLATSRISHPILLCPNTMWPSKHWPCDYWRELLLLLAQEKSVASRVVLVGQSFGEQGRLLAQWITDRKLPLAICPAFDLATMAYLIGTSSLLVAPDTGLLHLADFVGTQTIGIFGPTSGVKHGPFLHEKNVKARIQIACPHVQQKTHGSDDCMRALSARDLFDRIMLLAQIMSK